MMKNVIEVRDPVGASVGDTVGIEIPDAIASRAAVAVFVVPVIALFAGYLAGFLLGPMVGLDGDRTGTVLAALCAAVMADEIVCFRVPNGGGSVSRDCAHELALYESVDAWTWSGPFPLAEKT